MFAGQQRSLADFIMCFRKRQIHDYFDLRILEDFFVGHLAYAKFLGTGCRAFGNQVGASDQVDDAEILRSDSPYKIADRTAADDSCLTFLGLVMVILLAAPAALRPAL
jgi:hypothetical protein